MIANLLYVGVTILCRFECQYDPEAIENQNVDPENWPLGILSCWKEDPLLNLHLNAILNC